MVLSAIRTAIAHVLSSFPDVHVGLLFGSVSQGTSDAESDIDIALTGRSALPLPEIAAALSLALRREIDVVELRRASIPLLDELLREALVVYERSAGDAAAWRNHVLAQMELDRPWFHRQRDAFLHKLAAQPIDRG